MSNRKLGVRPFFGPASPGFTIIELMVSITILAVITVLALPSYSDMIAKRKLTSSAQQLSAFINQGHTEAARRNQVVTFSYERDDHDDWCVGAVLGEDACDCEEDDSDESDYCAIEGIEHVVNNTNFGDTELVHAMSGSGSFSFDPIRGILLDPNDAMSIELQTDSSDYKVNLLVNESGSVKPCSKDDSHAVPGYEVC